ncbi:RHS repeat domain-containing protein [Microbulbifer guangxiensis]|uniref:RHS repeat domain-containing protein n=1 Tax=Microbulbifer guangxiensis TaxID=2904249 RepID=UPI001F4117AA|nr:hypothetical protein [Microbulbifer guangxiensis]
MATSSTAAAPAIQTGVLAEVVIAGLAYRTETRSGITSAAGEFSYVRGETVQFFLGDTPIGFAVRAQERLRFLDLFPDVRLYRNFNQLRALYGSAPFSRERIEFNRFHNTLFLLEAFDRDSDLRNGIELDPGVRDLLDNVLFDLEAEALDFARHNIPLIYFRNRADALGLVDSGAVVDTGMVLDAYYEAVGLVSGFYVPVFKSRDFFVDEFLDEFERLTYDDDGNITELITDSDREILRRVSRFATYDDFGNILTWSFEPDAFLVDDEFAEFEYDSAGNLISLREDLDGNGAFDRVRNWAYDFGDRFFSIAYSGDGDGDGVFEEAFTVEYQLDERGRLQSVRRDDELLAEFTFQENGRTASEMIFSPRTGDFLRVIEFDESGRVSSLRRRIGDEGEGHWDFFYGSRDNLVRARFTRSGALFVDYRILVEWEYDIRGNLVLYTVDLREDGDIDFSREYIYDDDERLVREVWFELAGDIRTAVFEVAYAYDVDGRLVRKVQTNLLASAPLLPSSDVVAFIYGYDERGNLVSVIRDDGNNGSLEVEKAFELRRENWRAALLWLEKPSVYSFSPYEELPSRQALRRRLRADFETEEPFERRLQFILRNDEEFRWLSGLEVISINCETPYALEFFNTGEVILRDRSDIRTEGILLTWFWQTRDEIVIEDSGLEYRFRLRRYPEIPQIYPPGAGPDGNVVKLEPLEFYPLPYACDYRARSEERNFWPVWRGDRDLIRW